MPALNNEIAPAVPPLPADTDVQLALRAAAGDPAAFETIVRRHNRLLFRTARGVVSDDEAQDVVQETYLRAFTNLRAYRGDAALGTWLARIAINVALTSQRKKGRLVQLERSDDDDEMPAEPEAAMPFAPNDNDRPDDQAERKEMRELLQTCIGDLPPMYRTVFILRAVEELSVDETAFCLGVSEDVVKTRFLRARAMLRERIAARVEGGAQEVFAFAGARCDAVLAHVMTELVRRGLLRLH
jgi:RNA polymerase sigma factor (sigma-70 family)